MGRDFKERPKEDIEEIVIDCLIKSGFKKVKPNQAALLIRLIISGISDYFFRKPDNLVNVGFVKFKKNPDKDELFAVDIMRNEEEGIVNADTLWRYYKGELVAEEKLRGLIDTFVTDLLEYSQVQEQKIDKLTKKLS